MDIQLHKNARTPRLSAWNYSLSPSRWATGNWPRLTTSTVIRLRNGANARGWRCLAPPSGLHATAQEAVVAALRETLLLPLDDLLAVTCEFTSYAIRQAPKSSRAFSVRSG